MDEYTSEIMMGGTNTIALHNTCEVSVSVKCVTEFKKRQIQLIRTSPSVIVQTANCWLNATFGAIPHYLTEDVEEEAQECLSITVNPCLTSLRANLKQHLPGIVVVILCFSGISLALAPQSPLLHTK